MATSRFLFGNPPFAFLAGHLSQDEDFIADARTILGLSDDLFRQLGAALATSNSFLDLSALTAITQLVLGDPAHAARIAKIIDRIGRMLHDADMPATDAMKALAEAVEERAESLLPEERKVLSQRLRILATEPTGLARQQKAQKLVAATDAELEQCQVISDVRPIFDEQRERIEGAIPLSILRIEYSEAGAETAVIEVRITEKQIEEMQAMFATAKKKMRLMKEFLGSQNVVIPNTKATLPNEESNV